MTEYAPLITMQLMGKDYSVPSGLTIMAAIEYAGYKLVRGAGCRGGFCGACPTLYRRNGSHRMFTALACQTVVEDGMCLVQMPFVPLQTRPYELHTISPRPNTILRHFPEIAACVACNTCTRACPQGLQVMDYIQAALRGDIERASKLSFDCISCGICSSRCPADIKHYAVGQLARRIYGKFITPADPHLAERVGELEAGRFTSELEALAGMSAAELRARYEQRSFEAVADGSEPYSATRRYNSPMDPVDYQDEIEG
ncbi:MAG: 4Fe-4S dicluster domain-containing protein [Chloroflexales bacterium]|nr:4Fe-4S dicluster domain-containing protein [Chloroflexales bacterium]